MPDIQNRQRHAYLGQTGVLVECALQVVEPQIHLSCFQQAHPQRCLNLGCGSAERERLFQMLDRELRPLPSHIGGRQHGMHLGIVRCPTPGFVQGLERTNGILLREQQRCEQLAGVHITRLDPEVAFEIRLCLLNAAQALIR